MIRKVSSSAGSNPLATCVIIAQSYELGLAPVANANSSVPINATAICQATPFSDSAKKCRKFTRHFS